MKKEHPNINRRKALQLTGGLLGGGLMTGTAAAKDTDKKAVDSQKNSKLKKLLDSITVTNGKAKLKRRAKSSGDEKVEISANEKSLTFTSEKIITQLNNGVEKGYWKIKESAGKIDVDLTKEGRSRFFRDSDDSLQTQSHCNGETKAVGNFLYLDDDVVDQINWRVAIAGGVTAIAGAIVSVTPFSLAGLILTAAGILITLSATYIAITNEGCGIKINVDTKTVSSQHCDC